MKAAISSGYAKAAGILALMIVGAFTWCADVVDIIATLVSVNDYWNLALYGAAALLALISLVAVPYFSSRPLRYVLLTLFFISISVEVFTYRMFNDDLSVAMMKELLTAKDEAGFAMATYGTLAATVTAIVALMFIPLYMQPARAVSSYVYVIPFIAIALGFHYTKKNVDKLETLPANTALVSRAYLALSSPAPAVRRRQRLADTWQADESGIDTILYIVDESIRSDYLELNGYPSNNTPFLSSRADIINFGNAVSFTNCSASARMALRSFVRERDLPDPAFRVLEAPTFWQYARRAGYKTYYMDGWMQIRAMHSFLTGDELTNVDRRVSVGLVPFKGVDFRIAEAVGSLARNGTGKKFIFVEKIGLHQPYGMNFPELNQHRAYTPKPALSATQNANVQDYVDGLYSSVDRFFALLLPMLDMSKTLVIYTSDHGQALYEGGYEASHCSRKTSVPGEALVPLFIFAPEGPLRTRLVQSANSAPSRAAHADIAATLLRVMGYGERLVQPAFGDGLMNIPPNRQRRFFLGSPFGKSAEWVVVDK